MTTIGDWLGRPALRDLLWATGGFILALAGLLAIDVLDWLVAASPGGTFWFTIAVAATGSDEAAAQAGEEKTGGADANTGNDGGNTGDWTEADDVAMPRVDSRLKFLAAEDNHVNQLVLKAMLKTSPCDLDIVAIAPSGEIARSC